MQRTSEEKLQNRNRRAATREEDDGIDGGFDVLKRRSEEKGNVWGFWRDDVRASFKRTRHTQ